MAVKQLDLPPHYNPKHCTDANYFAKDRSAVMQAAQQWAKKYGITPAGSDGDPKTRRKRIELLVIDDQVDFSFPEGTLYVGGRSGTGAMDAHRNLVEWIYRYLHLISNIACTLDTHYPFQVFYPSAHLKADGTHPNSHTIIASKEYAGGQYQANPAMAKQLNVSPVWLTRQWTYYCKQLEKSGKYALYLWPYHCMLGERGHELAGVVAEARLFHGFARGAKNDWEVKGTSPLTENYSIFAPEVMTTFEGQPIPGVQRNTRLIKRLLDADYVVITGEASSHCEKTSIEDLLNDIRQQDEKLAKKIYIMQDCTAAVVIPNVVDFTPQADEAFKKFADAGMNLVNSTDPIESWPGIQLD